MSDLVHSQKLSACAGTDAAEPSAQTLRDTATILAEPARRADIQNLGFGTPGKLGKFTPMLPTLQKPVLSSADRSTLMEPRSTPRQGGISSHAPSPALAVAVECLYSAHSLPAATHHPSKPRFLAEQGRPPTSP